MEKTIPNPNIRGDPVTDDIFYVIFNAPDQEIDFTLPSSEWGAEWIKEIDTANKDLEGDQIFKASDKIKVQSRSLVVMRNAT